MKIIKISKEKINTNWTKTAQELDPEIKEKFENLANQMSPEDLTHDGEISWSQAKKHLTVLKNDWKKLEVQVGHLVTIDSLTSAYSPKNKTPSNKPSKEKTLEKILVKEIVDNAFYTARKKLDLASFYALVNTLKNLPVKGMKKINLESLKIYYMTMLEKYPLLQDDIYPEYLQKEMQEDMTNPKNKQKYIDRLLYEIKTSYLPLNNLSVENIEKFINYLKGWPKNIITSEQIAPFLKKNYLKTLQINPELYNRIYPEFMRNDDEIMEVTKQAIIDYYATYANNGANDCDQKALNMMEDFKDSDWEISVLYDSLKDKLDLS